MEKVGSCIYCSCMYCTQIKEISKAEISIMSIRKGLCYWNNTFILVQMT